ncbi:hypothetical protein [Hydrocoleum sp. CS-953]|nr:hypothetical protein [Hydrocoleum sp. CS-953]
MVSKTIDIFRDDFPNLSDVFFGFAINIFQGLDTKPIGFAWIICPNLENG